MLDHKLKYLPLIGKKFGKLTILNAYPHATQRTYYFSCKCDCGNFSSHRAYYVLNNKINTCGKCIVSTYPSLVGQKFNKLLILSVDDAKIRMSTCLCDCGQTKIIKIQSILYGRTTSCGCVKKDLEKNLTNYRHGNAVQGVTQEYKSWQGMKTRCNNPCFPGYKYWGARGIKVCERWDRFENFLEDMGKKPGKEYSLDRINNNGNYEPTNCRWATKKEQVDNRRPRMDKLVN